VEQLVALKISEKSAMELLNPQFSYQGVGFPAYSLQNNNANIRRAKQRLEELERQEEEETKEEVFGDVRIVQNVEDNRVQIFFPGKPDEETRSQLKRKGFRWSRFGGCWQRHLSYAAYVEAKLIVS
jgi:hypothetical protein